MNLRDPTLKADIVIAGLGLQPHPEGGYFRETWRHLPEDGGRGAGTAILFLLDAGAVSHWHRVDADEMWIWQAGAPLRLSISPDGQHVDDHDLGPDLDAAQSLQQIVPRDQWQGAVSLGAWTLVTCTVSPAFRFEGFELAPPGWKPTPILT